MAVEVVKDAQFLIFMTQDAIPSCPDAFRLLLKAFGDSKVGMAYGRQLPRPQARAIERHARLANYPDAGLELRSLGDRKRYGIKTVFSSNSFAAYRRQALVAVGGFPDDALFAEDQVVAGRMLMSGWNLAYVGGACVTHSHAYSVKQELQRYFDVGVFHARNRWLLDSFGRAEGEGLRFVKSEMKYLLKHEPLSIPAALTRTFAKYLGYALGRFERFWPATLKSRISMSPSYWRPRRDPL